MQQNAGDDVDIVLIANDNMLRDGLHYDTVKNESGKYTTYNPHTAGGSPADAAETGGFVYGSSVQYQALQALHIL